MTKLMRALALFLLLALLGCGAPPTDDKVGWVPSPGCADVPLAQVCGEDGGRCPTFWAAYRARVDMVEDWGAERGSILLRMEDRGGGAGTIAMLRYSQIRGVDPGCMLLVGVVVRAPKPYRCPGELKDRTHYAAGWAW